MRHARSATDQHHAVDIVHTQTGVAYCPTAWRECLADQVLREVNEFGCRDRQPHFLARAQDRIDMGLSMGGKNLFGLARLHH